MPEGKYRGISLPKKMIEAIEEYIEENPEANYKSIADFVADSIRVRFEQLGVFPGKIAFLDINANEQGPLLYDYVLGRTIQIYVKPSGIECGECKTPNCRHVKFALTKPQTQALLQQKRKEGWKLPNV